MGLTRNRTFLAAWIATFLFNIAWGFVYPMRNVYIHDKGISLLMIGTLSTAGSISMSISGLLVGRLSDRLKAKRFLIAACMVISGLAYLGYLWTNQFFVLMGLITIEMAMIGSYTVMTETIITSVLPVQGRGEGFGRYRISGSIGFAVATSLLGLTALAFGLRSIFVLAAIMVITAACISLLYQERTSASNPVASGTLLPRRSTWQILLKSGLLWLVVADFIAITGSQLAFPFQNIYYKETLMASTGQIGFLATLSVLAEIPAMLGLGPLSDRRGRFPILLIGFITPTLTWLLIYLASDMTLLYPASILNGIGIIRYSVSVALISDRVPYEERGTLLGFTYITYGMGGMIAPTLGGLLAQATGVRLTFLVAALVNAGATLLFFFTMGKKWRKSAIQPQSALEEGN